MEDKVGLEEPYLAERVERDLLNRLSRIEGHARAIRRMLEEHQSCNDILVQMAAVKAALNQAMIKLLEGHMESCVAGCVASGDLEELERLKEALALVLRRS
ncbi:MAG: metal-sensitive transcriptional regulator [Candidatus Bipolaricaulia bacterium]